MEPTEPSPPLRGEEGEEGEEGGRLEMAWDRLVIGLANSKSKWLDEDRLNAGIRSKARQGKARKARTGKNKQDKSRAGKARQGRGGQKRQEKGECKGRENAATTRVGEMSDERVVQM